MRKRLSDWAPRLSALACGAAIATASSMAAALPEAAVEAEPIFTRAGSSLSEMVVKVRAKKEAIRGTLDVRQIEEDYEKGKGRRSRLVHREPLTLETSDYAPTKIHVRATAGVEYEVAIVHEGVQLASTTVTIGSSSSELLLEAGAPSPSMLNAEDSRRDQNRIDVTRIHDDLPKFSSSYDGVAVVLANTYALHTADDAQCAALTDWVRHGGTLVVAGSKSTAPAERGQFEGFYETWPSRCILPGTPATLAHLRGAAPLGAGRVYYADYAQLPNSAEMLRAIHREATQRSAPHAKLQSGDVFAVRDFQPMIAGIGVVLFSFAALAGPVLFARLRRRKKTERALVLVPLAAFGTFVFLVGVAKAFQEKSHVETISIRELTSGEVRGDETVARGFIAPRGTVRARPLFKDSFIGISEHGASYDRRGWFRVDDDGSIVLNERQPVDDYVFFGETHAVRHSGPITISCDDTECRVRNDSGAPLEDAVLRSTRFGNSLPKHIDGEATFRFTEMNHAYEAAQFEELERTFGYERGNVSLVARAVNGRNRAYVRVSCIATCATAEVKR